MMAHVNFYWWSIFLSHFTQLHIWIQDPFPDMEFAYFTQVKEVHEVIPVRTNKLQNDTFNIYSVSIKCITYSSK